ncbi:hypothetical protein [Delftia tsuruhatensis]|uniref:Uncharacterized protein n=1 Tax=Delftia tsuruhatensis TaxID=180282 RepID=A0AAX3SS76_9BURK|nr:hypothetical protein [Delftia tsuruhatensis]WFF82863.1 hypothetical protein PYR84_09240 [Delftia tsuruhatensis]
MEVEIIVKIIGAVVAVAAGLFALWRDVTSQGHGRRSRWREEYKFAKDFFSDKASGSGMHNFQKSKGYQALAGVGWIKVAEGDYLLNLPDSSIAMDRYVRGVEYLEFVNFQSTSRIRLKLRYRRRFSRVWRKWIYIGMYAVFAFLAVFPLFFGSLFIKNLNQWFIFAPLSLLVFGIPAAMSLQSVAKIIAAEKLVRQQRRISR